MKKLIVIISVFILSLSACFADSIKNFPKEPNFVFSFDTEWAKKTFFFGTESDKFISTIKNILQEKYSIDFDKDVNRIVFFKQNDEVLLSLSGKNTSKFIFSFTNNKIKPFDNNAFVEIPKELNSLIEKDKNFIYVDGKNLFNFAGEILSSIIPEMKYVARSFSEVPKEAKENNPAFELMEGINSLIVYFEDNDIRIEIKCADSDLSEQVMNYLETFRTLYSNNLQKYIDGFKEKLSKNTFVDFAMISAALYSHSKSKKFIDSIEVSLKEEDESVVSIKTKFDIAYIARSATSIKLSSMIGGNIGDYTEARDAVNKKICFSTQRVIVKAVEMYNLDNDKNQMTSLDISALVKGKYLNKITNEYCDFHSEGDLSKDGYITCKVHGYDEEYSKVKNTTYSSTSSNNSVAKEENTNTPKENVKIIASPTSPLKPLTLESWVLKDLDLEMLKCPAGSFMMGSPDEIEKSYIDYDSHKREFGFDYGEKPHKVTITKPFYIGKFEITQRQYESIIGKNPTDDTDKGDNKPVVRVRWVDAIKFCTLLNYKYENLIPKGYKFTLPTEAQWEYACRAGTTSVYNNGYDDGTNIEEVAWFIDNSQRKLFPVGQKQPNAWGIYDMHGSVSEWCYDIYEKYLESDVTDPKVSSDSPYHVYRGGSYRDYFTKCHSSARYGYDLKTYNIAIGFRVALVLDEDEPVQVSTTPIKLESWTLKDINLEMVKCPAGSFMMGTPDTESLGEDEILHKVTITKPFYIGKYEVTQKQYEDTIKTSSMMNSILKVDNLKIKGDNIPISKVVPSLVTKFCSLLNEKYKDILPKGYVFDLPTEAQWEYACRAGTVTSLYNGKNLTTLAGSCPNLDEIAWYDKNSEKEPHSVGLKKPNAWGIYDMLGNVGEWCLDDYEPYLNKDVIDPKVSIKKSSSRIYRGGSFSNNAIDCRSAARLSSSRVMASNNIGFRLVLVWDGKTPISDCSPNNSVKEETPKAETSSNNSSSTTQQKISASYDTKEYKPIKLKPFKTHPKVVVPEELELEP